MSATMRRIAVLCLLGGLGLQLGGCIVAPIGGGPGWCYYHPYRCR